MNAVGCSDSSYSPEGNTGGAVTVPTTISLGSGGPVTPFVVVPTTSWNGSIPDDMCKDNHPVAGALTLEQLQQLGIVSGPVTYQLGGGR